VVGETVADKSQLALFDILLDGIVVLVLANLLLGVGPAGDFDDHVEDLRGCSGARGKEGDIVPGRDDDTVLLKVDAVFERVGRTYDVSCRSQNNWMKSRQLGGGAVPTYLAVMPAMVLGLRCVCIEWMRGETRLPASRNGRDSDRILEGTGESNDGRTT